MASKRDLLHNLWGQYTVKIWGPLFKKHSKYPDGVSTVLNEVLGPSQHGAKYVWTGHLPKKPASWASHTHFFPSSFCQGE